MTAATQPHQTREEMQADALARAEQGESLSNYAAIFEGMAERGIDLDDVLPRENVFTFNAWRAKGRQVMAGKGQGVAVVTWIPRRGKEGESADGKSTGGAYPKTSYVWHVSQTAPQGVKFGVQSRTYKNRGAEVRKPGTMLNTPAGHVGEVVYMRTGGEGYAALAAVGCEMPSGAVVEFEFAECSLAE